MKTHDLHISGQLEALLDALNKNKEYLVKKKIDVKQINQSNKQDLLEKKEKSKKTKVLPSNLI